MRCSVPWITYNNCSAAARPAELRGFGSGGVGVENYFAFQVAFVFDERKAEHIRGVIVVQEAAG